MQRVLQPPHCDYQVIQLEISEAREPEKKEALTAFVEYYV